MEKELEEMEGKVREYEGFMEEAAEKEDYEKADEY